MAKVEERTPKRKTKQSKRKPQAFIIEEVYPDGMTREEYRAELRKYAGHFARLFLQLWPESAPTLIAVEEEKAA